ncbi:anthranilate phosphoribosyltransferase [Testudinibacter aquarius]|uniref:Anthranilate phosphoribosyltransferase n=1 Tax=Testudinibacter aquarius TaxID=1524974 RepID=A0A4R3Y660_9PAST|nr:anthranilate phosphoribosyltransferase [Testudinibacter aquarius]KAE9530360.1 anthranilate phosphoribosyltransferase [Testudinibacter aquarius]TCV85954.1 anthranilate phosphoribosyltransferase [Testudinibacter aquarius]TNG93659.1 anthranilate phosphoribosyltransferase [Testudinibacter aquarius]
MELQALLEILFSNQTLNQQQSHTLFSAIVQGKLSNEQLAAALIALKLRGESIAEIAGAVAALQQAAEPFPRPDYVFADIVGTGGDGANTINISTASAIVAATLGAKIAKHGNRSVSSKTGASDVLTALGVNINMSAANARQALDHIGVCFLFAQQYHLGFKYAMPVRNALKTRTIFNILGPLSNPAKPKHQLLGVYTPELLKPYAETALTLGHQHSFVVHGAGLDEVALHGKTEVAEIRDGTIEYYSLSPYDFGFEPQPLEVLRGGEPAENARMISALLQGKGDQYHAQAVAINTALLLKLFGHEDLKHNAEMVLDCLATGKPFDTLQQLASY